MKMVALLCSILAFTGLYANDTGKYVEKKTSNDPIRDYHVPVSSKEKKDVSYIVNTMGMASTAKIAMSHSSLKKAGKRIDHLHPFRFLMNIFTDEKMKASMHALKDRWFFKDFMGGVNGSMDCEADRDNLKPEFINDFADHVGLSPQLITPSIQNRKWEDLVLLLIKHVPRDSKADRYDM